ncbi:hypothetical protein cyc_00402 [Cyclospora cayetanensis]|uniref:Uncharacterized protein n=1 Tax=Cyclospora cayetanensis TaxID=88456 RepID=A0A1D3CTR0_9EIME|nr:hypothetical protein cyc_00402 [Cyclospora cayetanensis]
MGASTPSSDSSIAESVQRAQAIAASLARSKGIISPPSGPPAPPPSMPHLGFSHRPPVAASRGSLTSSRGTPSFDYGGPSNSTPRGSSGFDQGAPHGGGADKQPHVLPTPGQNEGSWNSWIRVVLSAVIAKRSAAVYGIVVLSVQLLQQRARKSAVRAMATVCAAIPKPDVKDPDLLGSDLRNTARQSENGMWVLDLPLQSGVCAVTAASPESWQQLQHPETIAALRRRRSLLGPPQYLSAPADAAEDETFDCTAAMSGEDDDFLKEICARTGAIVDIEPDQPQGYGHVERAGLRYLIRACTQGAAEKALRLLQVVLEEVGENPSPGQDIRGAAAASFWQSALPDEAEMMRRRKEAEERRKKRGQKSRSASPDRRGPNRLSFAPPPDELLTGPYAPLDK